MLVRLGGHLHRHVIVDVALFRSFGGAAVALPGKGTVTSKDIATPFLGIGTLTYSELPAGVGPAAIADQDGGFFSAGDGSVLIAAGPGGTGTAGHWDNSLSRGSGADTVGAHVSVDALNDHGVGRLVQCEVTATVEFQTWVTRTN